MGFTTAAGISISKVGSLSTGLTGAAGAAAVGTGAAGKLLAFFGGPWGIAIGLGQLGLSLLLGRRKPKPPPTPLRDHNVPIAEAPAKYVLGTRAVEMVITDGTTLPEGGSRNNHIRLIAPISEHACGDIIKVWINDEEMAFTRDSSDRNTLYPSDPNYRLDSEDATRLGSNYAIVIRQKFDADGTQNASMVTIDNPLWDIPDDRRYNGNPGLEDLGDSPTLATTETVDPRLTCPAEYMLEGDMCVPQPGFGLGDDTIEPTKDYTTGTRKPFNLEVKPIDSTYLMQGISFVQVDIYQPYHDGPTGRGRIWGEIPKVKFLVEGIKITYPGQTTAISSSNPIAILYWLDTVFSGYSPSRINTAAFTEAFNDCNDQLNYRYGRDVPQSSLGADGDTYIQGTGTTRTLHKKVAGAWVSRGPISGDFAWLSAQGSNDVYSIPRYSCNIEFTAGDNINDIREEILATCVGRRDEINGQIYYTVGKPRNVSLTLSSGDIDVVDCEPWVPIEARMNEFQGTLEQSEHNDYLADTIPFTDTQAVARDGQKRVATVSLSAITNDITASNVLSMLLEELRAPGTYGVAIGYLEDLAQMDIRPNQVLALNKEEVGFTNFQALTQGITIMPDGSVLAIVREYKDSIYDPDLLLPEPSPRAVRFPSAPPPVDPTGIQSEELAHVLPGGSVQIRMEVYWDQAAVLRSECRARIKGSADWLSGAVVSNRAVFHDVTAKATYEIQVRHFGYNNVSSQWFSGTDNTIDGDVTPPKAVVSPSVTFLPAGYQVNGTSPNDEDARYICVYESRAPGFTPSVDNLIDTFVTGPNDFFTKEYAGKTTNERLYVQFRVKDTSGNEGPLTGELSVVPSRVVAEGVRIHVGIGEPQQTLGEDGDIYLQRMGTIWYKVGGIWVDSGRSASGESPFRTFEIEASESTPNPVPPFEAPNGTTAYNLETGQVWHRENNEWTFRGDLTGERGEHGAGIFEWNADNPPTNNLGIDGDIFRLKTGEWYRKVDGVWVLQDGNIGRSGSRVIAIEGNGPPERPSSYTPPAAETDLAFAKGSQRFYQLELQGGILVWVLISDLSPNRRFFFTAVQDTAPTIALLNLPAGSLQPKTNDEAVNRQTGEIWQFNDDSQWIKVGDVTKDGGIQFGNDDPPLIRGTVYGENYVVRLTGKRFVWTAPNPDSTDATERVARWVQDGYLSGTDVIIVEEASDVPIGTTVKPGTCYVVEGSTDYWCADAMGVLQMNPDGTIVPPRGSIPLDKDPSECAVLFTGSGYSSGGLAGFGKVNDGWIDITGRYGIKRNAETDAEKAAFTDGIWPEAQQLPDDGTGIVIQVYADEDEVFAAASTISRRINADLYAIITSGEDAGEVFRFNKTTFKFDDYPVHLCGNYVVSEGVVSPQWGNGVLTRQANGTYNYQSNWSGGSGAGVDIRYRAPSISNRWITVPRKPFTTKEHLFTGLRAATAYQFEIRHVGTSTEVGTWNRNNLRTGSVPLPLPPTLIRGYESTVTDGRIEVDWINRSATEWASVDRLEVQLRGTRSQTKYIYKRGGLFADETFFNVTVSGHYFVRIRARNPSGNGSLGISRTFQVTVGTVGPTTPIPPRVTHLPNAPTGFFVTLNPQIDSNGDKRGGRAEWDYTHRTDGAAERFEIQYRHVRAGTSYTRWTTIGRLPTSRSGSFGGFFAANAGFLYQFRLRAVNQRGPSSWASFNIRE